MTKMVPEVVDRLIAALKGNNFIATACAYAGITHRSYRNWMIRGEKAFQAQEQGLDVPAEDLPFIDFYHRVNQAAVHGEVTSATILTGAQRTDWRAARDVLKMRYGWGKRSKEDDGSGGQGGSQDSFVVEAPAQAQSLEDWTGKYERVARTMGNLVEEEMEEVAVG